MSKGADCVCVCGLLGFLYNRGFWVERWKTEGWRGIPEQSYTHCVRHHGASCAGLEGRLHTHRHRQFTVKDAELQCEEFAMPVCKKISTSCHYMLLPKIGGMSC